MDAWIKRFVTPPFIVLAALVLWFWEWLWEPLERLMARLGRLPLLGWVESRLSRAPPSIALACFVLPGAAMLPFKVLGLYFIAHRAPVLGVLTFLAAKVVGTALVARIFALTRGQLLGIGWFARCHAAVTGFRDRVNAAVRGHLLYRRCRAALAGMKELLRQGRRAAWRRLLARWRAVLRLSRRRGRLTCC